MASKDKDTKTMEKLLKQFFKFQKGPSSGTKFRDDFVLKPEYERDLLSDAPLATRLKTVKDLFEVIVVKHLDESIVARLWLLLQDLLEDTVAREHRHFTLSFFSTLIQGQHDKLGIMRAQFFKVVKQHKNPEDFAPRLTLLKSLTDNGKDILHFEEEIGAFLLEFMHDAVREGQEHNFLEILMNVIKYNASYIDEDIINDIIESICALCCQSNSEKVVMSCLHVLDAIVCYSELPKESLGSFISTLCRTVNLEIYCPTSWKIMRNLMGTHLGYSSLWTMKCFLSEPSSLGEPGLLRGAVFYTSMSLWSSSEVAKLNATPCSILPSFLAAARCGQVLVMYEIVMAIYRLICKHEKELFHPVWTLVLKIMRVVLPHTMKTDGESTAMLTKIFHDTLSYIEELDQNGSYYGCVESLYSLISDCASYRPEVSVTRLIDYVAMSIIPINEGWLDQLDSLLTRFYTDETSIRIRINVLSTLADVISHNRFLYEKELVGIALKHLKDVHNEPDLIVRKAATELLVNLFLNSEPEQALVLLDVLDKILNRALERKEKVREEDAEDIKKTAHGLIRGLASSMYHYPSTVSVATFKLITGHLNRHYDSAEYLYQVTSIRHMMLECILRLRADEYYRVGLLGQELGFSHYLRAHDPPSYKRLEVPPPAMLLTANLLMPEDHIRQPLPSDIIAELESGVTAGGVPEAFDVIALDLETVFPVAFATRAIVKALFNETDWKIMLMLLKEIPLLLKNRALFVSDTEPFRKKPKSEVDLFATAICAMLCDKHLNLPDRLVNTPPRFNTSDFQHYVFPVLSSLIPYHTHLEPTYHQRIIKCLEYGLTSKCAHMCVNALLICTLEMRDAMVKLLPEVLLCLSKISATVVIAVPILEFLSTLTQLPKIFANFVSDQYMSVFAIALPYTNPFKYNHYTVSLAHHVIAAWFLKCRLPFRRDFGKFITKGLKANILLPFEEGRMVHREEMINEDSSNRKRSSSLTEQGSRRRQTISPRLDLKPPIDNNLLSFHKELTETCIDLMAMYAYSTCSPFPKRQSTAERILNGGRSMTWLVGNKLVTVTTSGCHLKALKHGLCDKCYKDCRVASGSSLSKEGSEEKKSKSENISTESTASGSAPPSPEDEKSASLEPEQSRIDQLIYGKHQEHQACCCWCKGWSEITIQRPTGSMSWSMRLQNEPHSAHIKDWKDHGNADISTMFLSSLDTKNYDEIRMRERGLERVGSDPVSIPQSPIKRHVGYDEEAFDEGEEGARGGLNPVRRTNSSPDVTSNTKNPLLLPEPPELELVETIKKISFPKELRGNCEAIPEEMGTTPPTTEAVLLLPPQGSQTSTTTGGPGHHHHHHPQPPPLDTKPPVPSSSTTASGSSSRHSQLQGGGKVPSSDGGGEPVVADTASLPPLKYKRDRGHTISVMSPARKTGREWDLSAAAKSVKPKESSRCSSGVNPAFVFLQLYHSPFFGCNHEKPILVPPETAQTIKHLSWIPPYEVHKIGVLYVGPGQANSEVDILQNEYGSPRYIEFLQRLGTLINLDDADKQEIFLGGLGAGDGKFSYIWQDDVMQVIFHVATLMPNLKNDPKSHSKKAHIGNDFTTIVYNDSGEEYNLQTISSQFNYAAIVIEPLEHGTNQIKVKCKEELASLMYHTDYKVISDQSVSILARQLALHCNLAAIVMSRKKNQAPYASNWLERLRHIKRIHNRLVDEGSGTRGAQAAGHHAPENPPHHFTNHIHDFTEYT